MRHIISFYSHSVPKLVMRENGDVEEMEVRGEIDIDTSFNRYCTGYNRFGKGYRCPDEAVSNSSKCPRCRKLEMSCAACRGDECIFGSDCLLGEHHVYLAAFGKIVKAGVTKKERLNDRLVEQGADLGVSIGLTSDGMEARTLEALVQHQFGFKNSLRTSEKFKLLGSDLRDSLKVLENSLAEIDGFPGIEIGKIIRLSENYPRINVKPALDDKLSGNVLGAKGKLLFLERNGLKAIDMGKAVGRYITKEIKGLSSSSSFCP